MHRPGYRTQYFHVGDQKTLVADAFIPAIMAVIYLGLMLYFRGIGGYKPLRIDEQGKA